MDPENQDFVIIPDRMAFGGEAMGRLPDGRAVFVPFTLPGERVRARPLETKRSHVRAELIEVLDASAERIAPRCRHFTQCGGCHYQHIPYHRQLSYKSDILRDQLQRLGGLDDVPMRPIIASPNAFHYRNHLQFHLDAQGRLGFEAMRSNQVIAIQECHLPEPALDQVWRLLDIEPLPGLERVSLRLGGGDEILLILEGSDLEPFEFSVEELPLSAALLNSAGKLVLAGSDALVMEVLGTPLHVSADAFFQVNTPMAEALVRHILEILPLNSGDTLVDAYCGVGLFSAFLAPHVGQLIGIEVSPSACQDFEINLDAHENVALYQAPVEQALNAVDFHPQAMLVDPPRAGLTPGALDGILKQAAERLVYISCDPATLSRDAKRLRAGGYRLIQVTPFDLFPQTYHIESVSLWQR